MVPNSNATVFAERPPESGVTGLGRSQPPTDFFTRGGGGGIHVCPSSHIRLPWSQNGFDRCNDDTKQLPVK